MQVFELFLEDSNDSIESIKKLQTILNGRGADIQVDGKIGPETLAAIYEYFPNLIPTNLKPKIEVIAKSTNNFTKFSKDKSKTTTSTVVNTNSFKDKDFKDKLRNVAEELGIEVNDLAAIIYTESKGNPRAKAFNVSVGLIGFTQSTAKRLGTDKEKILSMSAIDQLDLVKKYYKVIGVRPGMSRGTLYMLTFLPAFARSPDNTVLGQKDGGPLVTPSGLNTNLSMHKIWFQNPIFGRTKGKDYFTVGDVKNHINSVNVPNIDESINENDVDPIDTVELDVPLLLRMMEYAREDAKTDMDLHDVTEKMIHLSKTGETLSMAQYDDIVGDSDEPVQEPTPEQPAQQEAMGGASAEEFIKSVEYKPHHPAKPKRSLMGKPMREGHGRYWCSTDKRWKERQGPKQSRG